MPLSFAIKTSKTDLNVKKIGKKKIPVQKQKI